MASPFRSPTAVRANLWRAIVIGGLACGACDFVFAVTYHGAPWNIIARAVAAGALGRATAYGPASWPVPLGIALHFVISFGAAAVFVFASRMLPILMRGRGIAAGLLYGALVYGVMRWVIVPASAIPVPDYPQPPDWGALVGHLLFVGLPIGLAAGWFLRGGLNAAGRDSVENEAASSAH